MYSKPSILLTGDDGYAAPGIRVVAAMLQDQFDLKIAGTTTQQSGVGGKLSLQDGFGWRQTSIDGIEALAVDGTPADAMQLASSFYDQPFDYIISGINWGANVSSGNFGSGTIGAAMRGLTTRVAPKAITISWDLPTSLYLRTHAPHLDITEFVEYPGSVVQKLVALILSHDFWGTDLININLPQEPTTKIRATTCHGYITDAFTLEEPITHKQENSTTPHTRGTFSYNGDRVRDNGNENIRGSDLAAINDNVISLTPLSLDMTQYRALEQMQARQLRL